LFQGGGAAKLLKRVVQIAAGIARSEPSLVACTSLDKSALVAVPIADVLTGVAVNGAPKWPMYRLELFAFPVSFGYTFIPLSGTQAGRIDPLDPNCVESACAAIHRVGFPWLKRRSTIDGLFRCTPRPHKGSRELGGLHFSRGSGGAIVDYSKLQVMLGMFKEAEALIDEALDQRASLGEADLLLDPDVDSLRFIREKLIHGDDRARSDYFQHQRDLTLSSLGVAAHCLERST
jgi:hypothetical protein